MNADYLIIALNIAVLGFVCHLNRDMRREIADLRECMARLEGWFEGFTRGERETSPPVRG